MINPNGQKLSEIIKQVTSLKEFYVVLGIDSLNTVNIFNSALAYLRGEQAFAKVKETFNSLITENKLVTEREVNLLNCLDELVNTIEDSRSSSLDAAISYRNIA